MYNKTLVTYSHKTTHVTTEREPSRQEWQSKAEQSRAVLGAVVMEYIMIQYTLNTRMTNSTPALGVVCCVNYK